MPDEELSTCLDQLRQSFEEGACGLSFGLGYDPGMYSSLEELQAFCQTAADAAPPRRSTSKPIRASRRVTP